MTNATKAQIIAAVNAALSLLTAFHVIFTTAQISSIDVIVNAVLALYVGITYKNSRKRIAGA
jgi:hypothetical protein